MVTRLLLLCLMIPALVGAQTTVSDRGRFSTQVTVGGTTFSGTSSLRLLGLATKAAETDCLWINASGDVARGACPTGDITSVALAYGADADTLLNGAASCATGACSFTVGFDVQVANRILAGPTTGANADPTFRALVNADMPANVVLDNETNTYSLVQHFDGGLDVSSPAFSVSVAGDVIGNGLTLTGDLAVNGGNISTTAAELTVDDPLVLSGTNGLTVGGNTLLSGSLDVRGIIGDGNDSIISVASSMTLTGDLAVNGGDITSTGNLTLDPAGTWILPGAPYSERIGSPFFRFRSLDVAELNVDTLVSREKLATQGGWLVVTPSTTLAQSLAPTDTTLRVRDNVFGYMDIIHLETRGQVEFIGVSEVLGAAYLSESESTKAVDTPQNAQTLTWTSNLTTTGAHRILIVGCALANTTNQSILYVKSTNSTVDRYLSRATAETNGTTVRAEIWYLVDPPSGATTFEVGLSAAAATACGSAMYLNVDQRNPIRQVHAGATGSASPVSLSWTGAVLSVEHLVINVFGVNANNRCTASDTETEIWDTGLASPAVGMCGYRELVDSDPENVSATVTNTGWVGAGIELLPAADYAEYTVVRDLDGTGTNQWLIGDGALNYGSTNGDGWLELYAERSIRSGSEVGPAIVVNERQSNTWNDWAVRAAFGHLNGLYGLGSGVYGAAFGDSANVWATVNDTDGFVIKDGSNIKVKFNVDGTFYIAGASGDNSINWNGSTLAIRGDLNADDISAGTLTGRTVQTAASCGTSAGACVRMTSAGIEAYDSSNIQQWIAGTSTGGALQFGTAVTLSALGMSINAAGVDGGTTASSVTYTGLPAGTSSRLTGYYTAATIGNEVLTYANTASGRTAQSRLYSWTEAGRMSSVWAAAGQSDATTFVQISTGAGTGTSTSVLSLQSEGWASLGALSKLEFRDIDDDPITYTVVLSILGDQNTTAPGSPWIRGDASGSDLMINPDSDGSIFLNWDVNGTRPIYTKSQTAWFTGTTASTTPASAGVTGLVRLSSGQVDGSPNAAGLHFTSADGSGWRFTLGQITRSTGARRDFWGFYDNGNLLPLATSGTQDIGSSTNKLHTAYLNLDSVDAGAQTYYVAGDDSTGELEYVLSPASRTIYVRNHNNSGNCTITVVKGLVTDTNCPAP